MQTVKIEVSLAEKKKKKAEISINLFVGAAIQTKGKKILFLGIKEP